MNMNNNFLSNIEDYMFTNKNLIKYTKYMIQPSANLIPVSKKIVPAESLPYKKTDTDTASYKNTVKTPNATLYKPRQTDSLFWCFYILKNGFSNYEMEINNQYFTIEKQEKFKYIETFRHNKDLLKIYKIKPYADLEDDLANKDRITIKTFFALCIVEKINILLVDNRKYYKILCADDKPINIVYRNSKTGEHQIELNVTDELIQKFESDYYNMSSYDSKIKSIGSYKVDELMDMCKRLNIDLSSKKKLTKKDIYELLVLQY